MGTPGEPSNPDFAFDNYYGNFSEKFSRSRRVWTQDMLLNIKSTAACCSERR